MIPIRDNLGRRGIPWVTYGLLLTWIGLFVTEWRVHDAARERLQTAFALLPASMHATWHALQHGGLSGASAACWWGLLPLLSHSFLQPSLLVLSAGAVFFQVFGGRLEARAGRLRFALFLLLASCCSAGALVVASPAEVTPILGASALVTACLTASAALHLRQRVHYVVPVIVFPVVVELPLWTVVPAWALLQMPPVQDLCRLGAASAAPWPAHVGACVAGLLCAPLLARKAAPAPPRLSH